MRIAFITNCLQPEKTGVGDYTLLMARECMRRQHQCCLIALNDRLLDTIYETNREIPTLRLPATWSWSRRIDHAHRFLQAFTSQWVSLQFVPYAFNNKGIIVNFSKRMQKLLHKRKLQIMFHELWIGLPQQVTYKERLIGAVQKFFVLRMIKSLQPAVIHTNNSAYAHLLKLHGYPATRLPLFGNIPVTQQLADNWLFSELQKVGLPIRECNRNDFWLCGFFGTLHPVWPEQPLFKYLHQASQKYNRRIVLVAIGNLSSGNALWHDLASKYGKQFTFLHLGERPAPQISAFLNSIDLGIATAPYIVNGKSGSIAAMLDHGLPVIVNRDIKLKQCPQNLADTHPLLYQLTSKLPDQIVHFQRQPPNPQSVEQITSNFLQQLGH